MNGLLGNLHWQQVAYSKPIADFAILGQVAFKFELVHGHIIVGKDHLLVLDQRTGLKAKVQIM